MNRVSAVIDDRNYNEQWMEIWYTVDTRDSVWCIIRRTAYEERTQLMLLMDKLLQTNPPTATT